MFDVLFNTGTKMALVEPVNLHGFSQVLESLFVELNGARGRAGVVAPLDDQHRRLNVFGVGDR